MAQINSLNYTTYAADRKVASRDWGGRKRSFTQSILCAAAADTTLGAVAVAAGDCVRMFRIPTGHKFCGGNLTWSALGAGTNIWVGDINVCDRFLASTPTVGASGCNRLGMVQTASFVAATKTPATGVGYLFTCDTDIIVAFGYGGAPVGVLTLQMDTVVE